MPFPHNKHNEACADSELSPRVSPAFAKATSCPDIAPDLPVMLFLLGPIPHPAVTVLFMAT